MDIVHQIERPIEVASYGSRAVEWYGDALYASQSVREVTPEEVEQHLYEPRSIVPSGLWTRFPPAAFLSNEHDGILPLNLSSIVHFQVPREDMPDMASSIEALSQKSLEDIAHSPVGTKLSQWFVGWSRKAFRIAGEIQNLGASGNYPSLLTATFGNTSARLIGLHLDSWDGTTIGQRLHSRYRACFNAGPGVRWLLFAPVPLGHLIGRMSSSGYDESAVFAPSAFDLVASGAITRIAALRILPGEGYIAATDTIFHDASTFWSTEKNINLQILFRAGQDD